MLTTVSTEDLIPKDHPIPRIRKVATRCWPSSTASFRRCTRGSVARACRPDDFRGQPRSNRTHRSSTDPEALLARKSNNTAARLCYAGHLLMENRNALIVDIELTQADSYAERRAALDMLERLAPRRRRRTVAADKAASPPTSPRTPPTGAVPSTGAPRDTPGTAPASPSGPGSKTYSDGSRPPPADASSATGADDATGPGSSSPARPTTSSASQPSTPSLPDRPGPAVPVGWLGAPPTGTNAHLRLPSGTWTLRQPRPRARARRKYGLPDLLPHPASRWQQNSALAPHGCRSQVARRLARYRTGRRRTA